MRYKNSKYTIEEVREIVESFKYKLISTLYINSSSKIEVECSLGHRYFVAFNNFKSGKRCPRCADIIRADKRRMNVNDITKCFEKEGYKIINGLDDYKHCKDKILVECPMNHQYMISPSVFINTGSRCPHCYGNAKYTVEEARKIFISKNFIPIFSDDEFKNIKSKVLVLCQYTEGESHYVKISLTNVIQNKGCRHCRTIKVANARRHSYDFVKEEFEKYDFELLEESYSNSHTKMKFRCNLHPELTQETTFNNLYYSDQICCKECYKEYRKENYTGENHHAWKGGVTNLREYLHNRVITEWKLRSMENSNYKCVITGDKFKDIHHLYSFHKILQETLKELGITVLDKINNYTKEELDLISKKCLEIHWRYPLGVCLRRDVHKLYHSIYGNDNTPEQFDEFKCRFTKGEFNEKLNIMTDEDDSDDFSFC